MYCLVFKNVMPHVLPYAPRCVLLSGLPTLKASSGFRLYDEFEDEFYFEYPKSWVARPNSMRRGVYISDFQAGAATIHPEPSSLAACMQPAFLPVNAALPYAWPVFCVQSETCTRRRNGRLYLHITHGWLCVWGSCKAMSPGIAHWGFRVWGLPVLLLCMLVQ